MQIHMCLNELLVKSENAITVPVVKVVAEQFSLSNTDEVF